MRYLQMFQFIAVVVLLLPQLVASADGVPVEIWLESKIDSMKKADVGPVLYPHKLHEQLYECGDCHPAIFEGKSGANDIDMQKNIDGKFCGSSGCHNSAEAFPLYLCENCHTGVKSSGR